VDVEAAREGDAGGAVVNAGAIVFHVQHRVGVIQQAHGTSFFVAFVAADDAWCHRSELEPVESHFKREEYFADKIRRVATQALNPTDQQPDSIGYFVDDFTATHCRPMNRNYLGTCENPFYVRVSNDLHCTVEQPCADCSHVVVKKKWRKRRRPISDFTMRQIFSRAKKTKRGQCEPIPVLGRKWTWADEKKLQKTVMVDGYVPKRWETGEGCLKLNDIKVGATLEEWRNEERPVEGEYWATPKKKSKEDETAWFGFSEEGSEGSVSDHVPKATTAPTNMLHCPILRENSRVVDNRKFAELTTDLTPEEEMERWTREFARPYDKFNDETLPTPQVAAYIANTPTDPVEKKHTAWKRSSHIPRFQSSCDDGSPNLEPRGVYQYKCNKRVPEMPPEWEKKVGTPMDNSGVVQKGIAKRTVWLQRKVFNDLTNDEVSFCIAYMVASKFGKRLDPLTLEQLGKTYGQPREEVHRELDREADAHQMAKEYGAQLGTIARPDGFNADGFRMLSTDLTDQDAAMLLGISHDKARRLREELHDICVEHSRLVLLKQQLEKENPEDLFLKRWTYALRMDFSGIGDTAVLWSATYEAEKIEEWLED
jgi:hypothetical protein